MLDCAILGYGNRGSIYAELLAKTKGVKIVCVCDTNAKNLRAAKEKFGLSEENCFLDDEEFFKNRRADFIVIATMDRLHIGHMVKAIRLGYDILLEKPIATRPEHCDEIERAVSVSGRNKILVCHVLRYTSFFQKIKELLESGELGEITSVSESENIAFVHYWLSFLHGNWHDESEASPIILQKCCHDFDVISWLIGKKCEKVSSFGNLAVYKPEQAPEEAKAYCSDCACAEQCLYCGIRIMNTDPLWLQGYYPEIEMTSENIRRILSDKSNPFSECAFNGRNNVMTDQIVNMYYEGGIVAQHLMTGFSSVGRREITIHAARGEIFGYMSADKVKIFYRPFQKSETVYDLTKESSVSGHGGGDKGLIESFVSYLSGENSGALSTLKDSLMSHRIAFAAEESRKQGGKVIYLP